MKFGFPKLFIVKITVVVFAVMLFYTCKSNTETENSNPHLELIASYPLQIEQPSGITFNEDFTSFWIVGGSKERVYKTDLKGNILEILPFKGSDLEGIYYDKNSNSLWLAEEELREVVKLDIDGYELARYKTDITGSYNNGLEGITFDESNNVFVLNEKNPKAIFALDSNFKVIKKFDFDFAGDLSDLYYNPESQNFFVLSDESKALYVWSLKDGPKTKFSLPFTKFEGITANPSVNKIVIVNDSLDAMYEYELKQ